VKLSNLVYAGAGYVLGARAGYERYEQIVRLGRRVAGSQTVQATAGVVQGQFDHLAAQARHALGARLTGAQPQRQDSGVNGFDHC
jgi:hypothetical protein